MGQFVPFTSYAPDLPPETPGAITYCQNVIPLPDGYAAQNAMIPVPNVDPLPGEARGFAVIRRLDNGRRVFAATADKIYELQALTWTDRSASGGYALGLDTENRARFAQFGNVTISSVGHANRLQSSTTGAFAAIANAPKAKVIETVNNFVFAFNYIDDVYGLGTRENGWWCSGLGNETQWQPSAATQATAGQFIEAPGPVVGAKRLGSAIVAYKERSAFIGEYVGVPQVWNWRQLPGEVGALGQESIVNIGTAHFFVGSDDFWMFDGSRFVPIGTPIRNSFLADLDHTYKRRIWSAHDKQNGIIYWFYPGKGNDGVCNKCVAYNYKVDKWGRCDNTIEAAADYIDAGVSYDAVGIYYNTYDDLPTDSTYNSTFPVTDANTVAMFNASHELVGFSGTPSQSRIYTHHIGDVATYTTLTKVRPRFVKTPSNGSMEYFYSETNADELVQGDSVNLENNVFDPLWSARWHKLGFVLNGSWKMPGFALDLSVDGDE